MTRAHANRLLNAARDGASVNALQITLALMATGDLVPRRPHWHRPEPPLPADPARKWPYYATADRRAA